MNIKNVQPNYVQLFNNHFFEFVEDIENVFPNNNDIVVTKNTLLLLKKANPKLIAKIWHDYIGLKYETEIVSGDITFFINKDYSSDLSKMDYSEKITEAIDKLREPIKLMSEMNQQKSMKYIQNLTTLAKLCVC
jgi:hypothetical protein